MIMAAFVFAPLAQAQALNVNGSLDTSVSSDINLDGNSTTTTSTTTTVTETTIDIGTEADTNVSTEVSSDLRANSQGIVITSSSQVESENDLEVFRSNITTQNEAVADVEINTDEDEQQSEIKVVYRHGGYLFGFIPVTVKSVTTVETNASGELEVYTRKSWYSFLVANENYSGAEIESKIKNNQTIKVNSKVERSAQARAKIAEAIVTELEAYAKTQAIVKA